MLGAVPSEASKSATSDEGAAAEAEEALRFAIHGAYIDVAKDKVKDAASAAEFVTKAAAAIGTIYTGLLALVYSVGSNPARPLPARGLAPAVFLALAFFFSVVNVGFLRAIRATEQPDHILPGAATWHEQEVRLVDFLRWVEKAGPIRRAWALRVAVVCLGASVLLLPLPFVSLSHTMTLTFISLAAVASGGYFVKETVVMLIASRRTRPG